MDDLVNGGAAEHRDDLEAIVAAAKVRAKRIYAGLGNTCNNLSAEYAQGMWSRAVLYLFSSIATAFQHSIG